jgi:hypothetical protein
LVKVKATGLARNAFEIFPLTCGVPGPHPYSAKFEPMRRDRFAAPLARPRTSLAASSFENPPKKTRGYDWKMGGRTGKSHGTEEDEI